MLTSRHLIISEKRDEIKSFLSVKPLFASSKKLMPSDEDRISLSSDFTNLLKKCIFFKKGIFSANLSKKLEKKSDRISKDLDCI